MSGGTDGGCGAGAGGGAGTGVVGTADSTAAMRAESWGYVFFVTFCVVVEVEGGVDLVRHWS